MKTLEQIKQEAGKELRLLPQLYNASKADIEAIERLLIASLQKVATEIKEAMMVGEKEQLDKNDPDNYGACYAIGGFNDCRSQMLANYEKFIGSNEKPDKK